MLDSQLIKNVHLLKFLYIFQFFPSYYFSQGLEIYIFACSIQYIYILLVFVHFTFFMNKVFENLRRRYLKAYEVIHEEELKNSRFENRLNY